MIGLLGLDVNKTENLEKKKEGRSKIEWCVVLNDSIFNKGKAKWESEEKFSG